MPYRSIAGATGAATAVIALVAAGLAPATAAPAGVTSASAAPTAALVAADRSVPTPRIAVKDTSSYMSSPRPVQLAGRRTLLTVWLTSLRPGARTVVSAQYTGGSTSCTLVSVARGGRSGTAHCWLYNPPTAGRPTARVATTTWMDGGFAQRRHAANSHVKAVRAPNGAELSPAATAQTRTCGSTGRDVSLTFDDMGSAAQVRGILAQLRRANAKGRFFLIGSWTRSNPRLVREILAAGHEVHNHTATHPRLDRLSDGAVSAQMRGGPAQIGASSRVRLFRPPYGVQWDTTRMSRLAAANGMRVCAWTSDTHDWAGATPAQMAWRVRHGDRVSPRVEAGGVVLMHVNGRHTSRGGVQAVVDAIRARGLRPTPLR